MATWIDHSTSHGRFDSFTFCCGSSNPCFDPRKPTKRPIYATECKNPRTVCPQEFIEDQIWQTIRKEAVLSISEEPILSKYYLSRVLSHDSLERALAHRLASKLCDENLSKKTLYDVFFEALVENREIHRAIRKDLREVRERDPACVSYVHCFLNFKGFLACQAHRLAHSYWIQGRKMLAFVIQNQVSEVFAVDIHPGAKIGSGVVFDHATGIVIGETAVIGNDVTIMHNVTLGGRGTKEGDRHPKIGDGVLIGAGAKVLGNVRIEKKWENRCRIGGFEASAAEVHGGRESS